jgi:c-di-GMP-binding flagellar brake protein YcgR
MGRNRRVFERVDSLINVKYASQTGNISGYSLTKDFSEGGVGLPVDGKIPAGTRLNITIIPQETGQGKIDAAAQVVWSRRNTEHWKSRYSAGLKFLEINPDDKERLLKFIGAHRWIKTDFERALEENKVPVLGGRGELLI